MILDKSVKRNSSVELLKIISIFMIIISHSTQTVGTTEDILGNVMIYAIDYGRTSTDIGRVLLIMFRHFGAIGNAMFMVCSSWFLIEMNHVNMQKLLNMILNVWCISVIMCGLYVGVGGVRPDIVLIIKSMLPTFFNNNWYITCYLIVYSAHGILNVLINHLSRLEHLAMCTMLVLLYNVAATIK